MTRLIKARLVAGWTIAYPTLGNGHMYVATSAARPGEAHKFGNVYAAIEWCEKHDVTEQDMALAQSERR